MEIKCKNCSHENICKWKKDMNSAQEKTNNILEQKNLLSPIRINIDCREFVIKNKKQDNLFYKDNIF